MDKIFYLGPLREHPQREYRWAGSSPNDVGPRGERTIDAILAATARDEMRNLAPHKRHKPFQEMIAHWLRELGLIDSFEIKEIAPGSNLYQACVQRNKGPDANGCRLRCLPNIACSGTSVLCTRRGSIVLMEQPEIHLHPSVQSRLADVMLAVTKTRRIQIVVDSHSEHLLRRFQRRVAEEEMSSSDLKLYFVHMEHGVAVCDDLSLNMWGEIENWPDEFFGDGNGRDCCY